jgi:NADP-dependent 3-hydroxy acid dehydrogenase YdfG
VTTTGANMSQIQQLLPLYRTGVYCGHRPVPNLPSLKTLSEVFGMVGTSLAGKTAWVIGGGSGLGAAAAVALAREGAHVVVSGRRTEALCATVSRIEADGGTGVVHPLDVACPNDVASSVEAIGAVDILVYSSGTNVPRRTLDDIAPTDWTKVVDVNLNGAFHAIKAVLPGMREKRDGVIMVISSWAGWRLEPVAGAAYSTTKHALLALTEVINIEEGPAGIRATCLCPAEVDTEVLNTRPVPPTAEARGRMLKADDLGSVISFIATAPRHMCVNQIVLSPVDNRFYHSERTSS